MWSNLDPGDQAILWAVVIVCVFMAVQSVLNIAKLRSMVVKVGPNGTEIHGYPARDVDTVLTVLAKHAHEHEADEVRSS